MARVAHSAAAHLAVRLCVCHIAHTSYTELMVGVRKDACKLKHDVVCTVRAELCRELRVAHPSRSLAHRRHSSPPHILAHRIG